VPPLIEELLLLKHLLPMLLQDPPLPLITLPPALEQEVTEDPIPLKLEEVQINALLVQKLYMKTNKLKPVVVFGTKDASNVPNVACPST
jgi:ATP sulfurylase